MSGSKVTESRPTSTESGDFYHGSTHKDIERLIAKIAWDVSRKMGLDFKQHGEDMISEGWVAVAQCSQRYKPRGYKFTTYITTRIFWRLWGYGQKRAAEGKHAEIGDAPERTNDPEALYLVRELLAAADEIEDVKLVLMHAWVGMNNKEIEEATGERDISKRRAAALAALDEALA